MKYYLNFFLLFSNHVSEKLNIFFCANFILYNNVTSLPFIFYARLHDSWGIVNEKRVIRMLTRWNWTTTHIYWSSLKISCSFSTSYRAIILQRTVHKSGPPLRWFRRQNKVSIGPLLQAARFPEISVNKFNTAKYEQRRCVGQWGKTIEQ